MSNLSFFEFKSTRVRTVFIDGNLAFCLSDSLKAMNSKTTTYQAQQLILDYLGEGYVQLIPLQTVGGSQEILFVFESGLTFLLSRSRKIEAKDLAVKLGLNLNILAPCTQSKYISIIQNAFAHLKPIEEFFISGYRIDLYFPSYKIAVECDEKHHKSRNIIKEDLYRQDSITKLLGCTWVRFSPSDSDFCIGKVINNLILKIKDV